MNNNQKQSSEPAKPEGGRRRDLSKATAMHILGPSKNLNKENEGNGVKNANDNDGKRVSGDAKPPPRDRNKL